MDETSQKIIDATLSLVRDKGYVATTTRDIASQAGVNECTIFRKFASKKDIVLAGMEQEKWRADISPRIFSALRWELVPDLTMFMQAYMDRVSPDFVNLSIGLRAPQIYAEAAPLIMKIPQVFLAALTEYFSTMAQKGKLAPQNFEALALALFSATFGYTFLRASFEDKLSPINQQTFIAQTVQVFVQGLEAGNA